MKDLEDFRVREALNAYIAAGGGVKAWGRADIWELMRLLMELVAEEAEKGILQERKIA